MEVIALILANKDNEAERGQPVTLPCLNDGGCQLNLTMLLNGQVWLNVNGGAGELSVALWARAEV